MTFYTSTVQCATHWRKGLLGHSSRGVTQGYVHLDVALVVAAERVSAEIATILDGKEAQLAANLSRRGAVRLGAG
jgi:hypothetical protein